MMGSPSIESGVAAADRVEEAGQSTPVGHGQNLRVLRLLTRFNVGGPARQALALQGEMQSLGVSTTLAGGVVQEGEADLAERLGVREVVRLQDMGRRPCLRSDLRAVRSVYELIRRTRPHVVHTHMAKAGAIGRLAGVAAGVPVRVHTFHGHTLHGYFSPMGNRGVVEAERILARMSTALVAVSHQVRDDLLARGVGRPDKFHVIGAGLDLSAYASTSSARRELRTKLGMRQTDKIIGIAGRLVPVKAIDQFLSAVGGVLAERGDVHVVVAGDGPDMALVRAAQQTWPSGGRIHALGWLTDMAEFYAATDVVVLSSRNEGTPLALIEAGAAGVPVVAPRVGGVPEVVEQGVNGLLVAPGSPEQLGAAIRLVLDDSSLAVRLGAGGREMAARFAAARAARALGALYRELLAGARELPPGP